MVDGPPFDELLKGLSEGLATEHARQRNLIVELQRQNEELRARPAGSSKAANGAHLPSYRYPGKAIGAVAGTSPMSIAPAGSGQSDASFEAFAAGSLISHGSSPASASNQDPPVRAEVLRSGNGRVSWHDHVSAGAMYVCEDEIQAASPRYFPTSSRERYYDSEHDRYETSHHAPQECIPESVTSSGAGSRSFPSRSGLSTESIQVRERDARDGKDRESPYDTPRPSVLKAQSFWDHPGEERTSTLARLKMPQVWSIWAEEPGDNAADKSQASIAPRRLQRQFSRISFEANTGNLILQESGWLQWLVVRPNDPKRIGWDLFSVAVVMYDLITIPLTVFQMPPNSIMDTLDWVTTLFWSCDILWSFLTGYHNGGAVEMRPRAIAKQYILRWFIVDVAIVVTDWIIIISTLSSSNAAGTLRVGKTTGRITRVFRAFRLLRFMKMKKVLVEVLQLVKSEYLHILFNIALSVTVIAMINHYIACGWYLIGREAKDNGSGNWLDDSDMSVHTHVYYYLTSLHWSLTQFTPASMEVRPNNLAERAYSILVLMFALLVFSSFVASITNAMTQLRRLSDEQTTQQFALRKYFSDNKVSAELGQRIWTYLRKMHFENRARMPKEDCPALKLLSDSMMKELNEELYRPYIILAPVFYEFAAMDTDALADICNKSVDEAAFTMGTTIFSVSDEASDMYLIISGSCEYLHLETFISHNIGAEHWVCEPILWLKWVHFGNFIASTSCEVLKVNSAAFRKTLERNVVIKSFFSMYVKALCDRMINVEVTWHTDVWLGWQGQKDVVREARKLVSEQDEEDLPEALDSARGLGPVVGKLLGPTFSSTNILNKGFQWPSAIVSTPNPFRRASGSGAAAT